VAAYHVVWECVVEQWLGVRRTTLPDDGLCKPKHFVADIIVSNVLTV